MKFTNFICVYICVFGAEGGISENYPVLKFMEETRCQSYNMDGGNILCPAGMWVTRVYVFFRSIKLYMRYF